MKRAIAMLTALCLILGLCLVLPALAESTAETVRKADPSEGMALKVILLLAFFAVMVGIGIYCRKNATDVKGFVLGGRAVAFVEPLIKGGEDLLVDG